MRPFAMILVLAQTACSSGVGCISVPPARPCPNGTECAPPEVCVEMFGHEYGDSGLTRELFCRTPCVESPDCIDYGKDYPDCYGGMCYLQKTDGGQQGFCGCMPIE
jgi:hypothetical protein